MGTAEGTARQSTSKTMVRFLVLWDRRADNSY